MKLVFELSHPGRHLSLLPPCDVPAYTLQAAPRKAPLRLPELSETAISRHYTELADQTTGVNNGFYPLGSCTMKYNPKINEEVAALPGFTDLHPLQPPETVPGAMELMLTLKENLCAVTGMDDMTLPALRRCPRRVYGAAPDQGLA
jgi:glycine dehydrogenase subunit 2